MLEKRIAKANFSPYLIGEQIAHILTDAILENVLKGGEQLREMELQKEFQVSRSPLREAFRDLEKKGLVEIVPRRGTFVKKVSREDIEYTFPVRATLEGLAARLAHARMVADDRSRLAQALTRMRRAVDRRDTKGYWKHHLDFHDIFIRASANPVLIGHLQNLRMHSMWHRFSYKYYEEDLEKAWQVHARIQDRFNDPESDPAGLEALVRRHVEDGMERFLTYLEDQ